MQTLIKDKLSETLSVEELLDRYAPIRKALIARYSVLDKDDLDQELKIITLNSLADYDPQKSTFGYFVKQRCTYHCLDKIKEEPTLSLDKKDEDGLSILDSLKSDTDLEQEYQQDLKKSAVIKALETLDSRQRQILYGIYFEGRTMRSIAREMNYSVTHIGRIRNSGLRSLRTKLKNMEEKYVRQK